MTALKRQLFPLLIFLQVFFQTIAVELSAHFSESGIHGTISFFQDPDPGARPIHLTVDLVNRNQFDGNQTWTWFITEFPVDYALLQDRCNPNNIGGLVADLGDLFGPITFNTNESVYFEFESSSESEFALVGAKGVWGRSMVLVGPSQEKSCATIIVTRDEEEWVAEARFLSGIAGSVFFRWVGSVRNNVTDNAIYSNLLHLGNQTSSRHLWKIYITDILDSEADKSRATCDFLQILFNPGDAVPAVGDLSARLGPIPVGQTRFSKSPRSLYRDTGLSLLPADLLGGRRSLYLVVFDHQHQDSFLACAKIRTHRTTVLKGIVQSNGVLGTVSLSQRTQFNPTRLEFNLTSFSNDVIFSAGCKIHELPADPYYAGRDKCSTTGPVYNPVRIEKGFGSQDRFPVGDIDGKESRIQFIGDVFRFSDVFMPLYGPYSVAHRSVVFYRYFDSATPMPWVCATLHRYKSLTSSAAVPMISATALYRYPIVGTIMLRQPTDSPFTDTTIIIETLVHADGLAVNDTMDHRWSITENPPGRDFYNWSMRCVSAGGILNPNHAAFDENQAGDMCSNIRWSTCRVGDLNSRHGHLGIAGSKKNSLRVSRRVFTDSLLPLSGIGSVIGKSLVIYDDHGPVARGDRLACSRFLRIEREYRRKAVTRNWFSNGKQYTVSGKMEFLQQSKYDMTNLDITVEGLVDTSGYHIHMVPVQEQLEFPCESSTLYGHFNPYGINPQTSPRLGTPDQFEAGDLSGKFGTWDNKTSVHASYNDSSLTLFGTQSILGRSVVINKRLKNSRWMCSSIERGYAPTEARELRAIASFHHPGGFAYGYVRMTQLVYRDGSKSDTVVEVNLRYPGKNDRNRTRNHNWAIFVNSVSVDASVPILNTRCTAGGYVWNPYYTQLADPLNENLYRTECGPDNPLRCYVGDLSGRLGTVDVGDKRQIFSDGSIPLEGDVSAMGRSIIVYTPERGGDRMACANIAPDNDIIKYANIRASPGFVGDLFLEEFREIMGIPDWFLTVDTRQTKPLYGGNCMQFLLHFKGPEASKLELDFSHLLSTGNLPQPSIYIPGHFTSATRKSKTSYRPCGSDDPSDAPKKKKNYVYHSDASQLSSRALFLIFSLISARLF